MPRSAESPFYHPDYARLTAYLQACEEQQIVLTFTQLEQAVLLGQLPWGARRQASWWTNTLNVRRPQNRAWLDVGWRVTALNRTAEMVTFERSDSAEP